MNLKLKDLDFKCHTKIWPAHKRTIILRYDENYEEQSSANYNNNITDFERHFIHFPKTLFYDSVLEGCYSDSLNCVAINEKDELCYMPLFNVTAYGLICLIWSADDDENKYSKYSLENKIKKFFAEPFKVCGDDYAQSIWKYFKIKYPAVVTCTDRTKMKIREELETLYKNPIKLIPLSGVDKLNLPAIYKHHV